MREVQRDDLSIHDADPVAENLDHRFTAQIIAYLDRISADMLAGNSKSMEEVDKHLANVREAWLKDHAS